MYTIINVKQTCKYVFAYMFVDYTSASANFTYYIEIGNVSNRVLYIFIENCQKQNVICLYSNKWMSQACCNWASVNGTLHCLVIWTLLVL